MKKIILTGGGTGGPVTPLLALADKLRAEDYLIHWIGTENGIEREMVKRENIPYSAISSGRLRRYLTWKNLTDPFLVLIGFIQSLLLVNRIKPALVMSAGSFVSVPVAWAAFMLRIPILVHQQDVRPGLANKLMAPFAKKITVTFEKSLADYGSKAVWVGNTVREELRRPIRRSWAMEKLGLRSDLPVVVVMGGGTGAAAINELLLSKVSDMTKSCQIIHITGRGKNSLDESRQIPNYKPFEFVNIEGLLKIYAVADLVVSRCGLGVLTELSFLGKPCILIPMPDSHQEDNAEVFDRANAAIVMHQRDTDSEALSDAILRLLKDKERMSQLSQNIRKVIRIDDGSGIMDIIKEITS